MTSQGNGQPVPYEVKLSTQLKNVIKQQHQKAVQQGRGQQYLDALRIVHERLRKDPAGLGEALFHLPALKLLVCHAVVSLIAVDFAIHQERPLVFLRGVILLG